MGYTAKLSPGWFTLGFGLVNLAPFTFEMNFIINGSLKITANDDLGPVETELIIATIFFISGVFGISGMDSKINE